MSMQNFPLKGTAVGGIVPLTVTSGKITGVDTTNVMLFDKLAEGKFSVPPSATAEAGNEEFVEWKSSNQTTFRFKKTTATYDIKSTGLEEAASSTGATGDAFTLGFTSNDTPLATAPATITYADFMNKIKAIREKPCLVILPFGLNAAGSVEGTAVLIGKISAGIEQAMGDGTALTIPFTFNGFAIEFDDTSKAATITAINTALPNVTPIGGVEVNFLTITATHVDNVLEKGELLFA